MDWLKEMLDEAWVEKPSNPSESTRYVGETGDGGSRDGDGEEEDRQIA